MEKESKQKKVIKLYSRYHDIYTLTEVDKGIYELGKCSHYRVGLTEDAKECSFIDPPGGPFLRIGDTVEGIKGTLAKIRFDTSSSTSKVFLIFKEDGLSSK